MTTTTAKQPKVIKRYANRKLYDTERSCYVTLDEISQMIKEGDDVKVVDNKTKDDLTAVTLAQIIVEGRFVAAEPDILPFVPIKVGRIDTTSVIKGGLKPSQPVGILTADAMSAKGDILECGLDIPAREELRIFYIEPGEKSLRIIHHKLKIEA